MMLRSYRDQSALDSEELHRSSEIPALMRSAFGVTGACNLTGVFLLQALVVLAVLVASTSRLQADNVAGAAFTQSAPNTAAFDFIEVTANIKVSTVRNPFTDALFAGDFEPAGSTEVTSVMGFCDSSDGTLYRIRFMPSKAGAYTFHVFLKAGDQTQKYSGTFTAIDGHQRGPIRVDPAYPWSFIWEGTGEHYFFNGTTAYWLLGWRDERTIQYSIDRLAGLKVNRMRVTLAGRTFTAYGEPAMNGERWNVFIDPWPAQDAHDFSHPGFDYSRFNVPYWQKFDRMLRHAREDNMIISIVLGMNDEHDHPAASSEDERRYIRYAIARFGSFSNITWDLGDDLDGFRSEAWTHETGMLIEQWDPYHHLATSHPVKTSRQDRSSGWFGFTSYQDWSRSQHALMLESRELQKKAGRIIPQTNEEYGYEDHYPEWAAAGSDSADALRRTAWDIYMAGGYQTAGESVRRGTNIWPDTGGGWMNGRGDDTQTMFLGYGHIVDFFTSFDWWKTSPHDELVNSGNYCLSEPGSVYAVYLPHGGKLTIQLAPGTYRGEWMNAISGQRIPLTEDVTGPSWTSPGPPEDSAWSDAHDWALLLRRR
jgi:hypothetical protein